MIVAAAVCPHPPVLVPAIAPGTADELGDLRQACDDAVSALMSGRPGHVVVIGSDGPPEADPLDGRAGGTLTAYGVEVSAGGDDQVLPLSLTLGAWLLDRAGWSGPRTYSQGMPITEGRIGLLVMADFSARRSVKAPGFLDERAEGFDASIAKALAAGDADALTRLDTDLAHELSAVGVPALKTLGELTRDAEVVANLRYDAAPLGVGYLVADWQLS